MNKKIVKNGLILACSAGLYPVFVLGYTWCHVCNAHLEGGKNGPLDAYRHTLASAIVSYTLNESAVYFFTELVESRQREDGLMDRHNNLIGAQIGSASPSFSALEPAVRQAVSKGATHATEPQQITWLPEQEWHPARFW